MHCRLTCCSAQWSNNYYLNYDDIVSKVKNLNKLKQSKFYFDPMMTDADKKFKQLLYNRNFVLFLLMRSCNVIGVQIVTVAVGWHVYQLTRDPFLILIHRTSSVCTFIGLFWSPLCIGQI